MESKHMTTLQLQTEIPFDTLLESLPQLATDELDRLANQVIRLQAQRRTATIPDREAELLTKIGQGIIPFELRRRCTDLTRKQRAGDLTETEYQELSNVIDEIEILNAKRIGYLVELAELREITLDEVIAALELAPLNYE